MAIRQRWNNYNDKDIMKADKELREYQHLKNDIKNLRKLVFKYEQKIYGMPEFNGSERVKTSISNIFEKNLIEWINLKQKVENLLLDSEKKKIQILEKLEFINQPEREVLKLYYLEGKTIDEIANITCYATRTIKIHKREGLINYSHLN